MNDGVIPYNPWWRSGSTMLGEIIVGQAITFLVIVFLFVLYAVKLRKTREYKIARGYVFVFQIYIEFIHNLCLQILGKKLEKLTPFFIYLFSYILVSNVISIFGFINPTSSLTITLALAVVTFIGCFVIGFKYQKLSFFKKYALRIKIKGKQIPVMINPLNIISQVVPLISLSFRLWGNIFAGTIITSMMLFATNEVTEKLPLFNIFDILGGVFLIPTHIYFDMLSGVIQALVFTLLTMMYWKMEIGNEESIEKPHLTV